MKKAIGFLYGLCFGAGMMYLFDPDQGNRRRALIRDKAVGAVNDAFDGMEGMSRDMGNRMRGMVAEGRSFLMDWKVSDSMLEQRIRAKMGHMVENPQAI